MRPHIAPIQPGTRPELASLEAKIRLERGEISPLYQVLLNSPAIASGWEAMLTAVRKKSVVPAHLREVMILRIAVLNRASFEFDSHLPYAQAAGVSNEKIQALRQSPLPELFDEEETLLLKLTDYMTQSINVPEAIMSEITRRYSPQQVLDTVATIAAYNMVSRLLVALNIVH
jgi:4-carboxymuconolactone decarboxylase